MNTEQFPMVAKTLQGLEEVLAQELSNLGARNIEIGRRMVSFSGDKKLLYNTNFRLRTALRILKPIETFFAKNADELYSKMRNIEWSKYLSSDKTFAIDTVVYSESFTHSKYVGYKAKDAIVDYFKEIEGKRPCVSIDNPDALLNIHISHNNVTISLDSSGESLHKRGYREVQTAAPINEVLAAGILLIAGWDGQCDFLDPMCGSGTFPIEAALIARNIAPGIYRKGYAFQKWSDYDEDLFDEIYNDESQEREFKYNIVGSDISAIAVEVASRNIARAGLKSTISIEKVSIRNREAISNNTLIVTNPPYGERLKISDAETMYSMIGERLKHTFAGSTAWIIGYKKEHFDYIGLKPTKKVALLNGSLECELRGYQLFEGKHRDFKKEKKQDKSKGLDKKKNQFIQNTDKKHTLRKDLEEREKQDKRPQRKDVHPARFKKKESKATDKKTKSKDSFKDSRDSRLWPNDRFRAMENRQHFGRRLQVYRADDINDNDK